MVFLGIAIGIVVTGIVVLYMMRNFMVVSRPLPGRFDVVCEKLAEAIKAVDGWGQPIPHWDLYASQVAKGLLYENIRNMKVFFVCKSPYANKILRRFPHMAALMPCSWAVYETTDGEVHLAKMNISLMGKMFLGNIIGTVMGSVAREEHLILEELFKRLESVPEAAEPKPAQ